MSLKKVDICFAKELLKNHGQSRKLTDPVSVQVAILWPSVTQSVCNRMQWLKSGFPKCGMKSKFQQKKKTCNVTLTMRYYPQVSGVKMQFSLLLEYRLRIPLVCIVYLVM